MMRRLLSSIATGMLFAAAACSHTSDSLPSPGTHVPVAFMIKVPQAGAAVSSRRPEYVSPATQAIAINKQAFNITPSSPNCATQNSNLICSFTVDAPNLGPATFTITTYDMPLTSTGATQGNQLSTGSTTATIFAGQQNTVKATLNGVPAHATISIAAADLTPPIGQQETVPVSLDVRDADGYAIVGTYATPIYLEFQGGYSYGVNFYVNGSMNGTVSTSSDVVQLQYSGHNVTSTTIIGFIGNAQNQVYSAAFKPVPGFGPETPIPAANVGTDIVTTDIGQHVWFTEPSKGDLAVSSAGSSSLIEIPMPSGGAPAHLTAIQYPLDEVLTTENGAADFANVWYYNQMPSGPPGPAVYEHPLSSASAGAYQVAAAGPNYASYAVTEGAVGKIAISTSNGITEYPTGVPNSSPAGIVWNSGGYYFADTGANAIGSISSNNTITEYPLPSSGAAPTRMAINEVWDVWFIEPGVSKVGHFTYPTQITEYPCSGVPVQVVAGQFASAVLTASGDIDVYENATGNYVVVHPPASSAGPIVGMGLRADGDAVLLRSNGTTSALQDLFYY
jgi:virginiamycin B lyase